MFVIIVVRVRGSLVKAFMKCTAGKEFFNSLAIQHLPQA